MNTYNNRINILLDLDSTLICSLSIKKELKRMPKKYQKKFNYIDMKNYYRIFERPNLQVFLDYLFNNFNVSVFTAADKDYALFIIENIILRKNKENRKIHYVFYNYHSEISENIYNSPKDLRMLWDIFTLKNFNKNNTYIIDDLDLVKDANPNNVIVADKFEILDGKKLVRNLDNDNFLLRIIPYLESINTR